MKVIQPYGNSRTKFEDNRLTRKLHLNRKPDYGEEIEPFAHAHHELVIAQWISVIDKIATKPTGTAGATESQRELRTKLGKAAWNRMIESDRIAASGDELMRLSILWSFKVHPYDKKQYKLRPHPDPRGRWYDRFVGEVCPTSIDAAQVATVIEEHLYTAAKRLHPECEDRPKGHIHLRAASIQGNAVNLQSEQSKNTKVLLPDHWIDADEDAYFCKIDVAKEIYKAATEHEATSKHPFRLNAVAALLDLHWQKVFGPEVKHFRDVPEDQHGVLAFHVAVKAAYRTKLKRRTAPVRSKRDTRPSQRLSPASCILPKCRRQLSELVQNQRRNRRISDLIRRGKLAHYTANDATTDSDGIEAVLRNWPSDLSSSRFRTSAGQAEIKRAEAFVRIWRHTIALSALTMRDWASMRAGDIRDVFGSKKKPCQAVCSDNFDREQHDRKVRLLLGGRAEFFEADEASRKEFLKSMIRIGIELRNAGFHFKGRGGFVQAFEGIGNCQVIDADTIENARKLWNKDMEGRSGRIRDALVAVDADRYFSECELVALLKKLENTSYDIDIPLPRFRRMLQRVENTWKGMDTLDLPKTANRTDMENQPALRCRYVVLKDLYEGPFRAWMQSQDAETITKWIKRAIDRSDLAAKDMNDGDDEKKRIIIEGKAAALLKERKWKLADFLETLSRATASAMQVKKGYGHNGEAAREQSRYINDVLCDVIALGFETWVKAEQLTFVTKLDPGMPPPEAVSCDVRVLPSLMETVAAQDWQIALYLFLHTVPVSEVSRLLHQLAKWEVTATKDEDLLIDDKDRLRSLATVLKLYIAMHDAKFEGGDALTGITEFKDFFENSSDFDKVFPAQSDGPPDRHVPRRGLREIMRFGHRSLIQKLTQDSKITDQEVHDYLCVESGDGEDSVAGFQKKRENLHEEWVCKRRGKSFSADKCRKYAEVVVKLSKYRQLAHRVKLTDQLHLHTVLMKVLGRLVDYSGLFERDLYFVTLGLLHEKGLRPSNVMKGEQADPNAPYSSGLKKFAQGRIFDALSEKMMKKNPNGKLVPNAQALINDLEALFGEAAGRKLLNGQTPLKDIRNALAHFDWLHNCKQPLNLTAIANDVRTLLSYDRKLKNAVSKSLKELLEREGFYLCWTMRDHLLSDATVASKQALHLGGQCVYDEENGKIKMVENLRSPAALKGLATLFDGNLDEHMKDMCDWDFNTIKWSKKQKKGGKNTSITPKRNKKCERKAVNMQQNHTLIDDSFEDYARMKGDCTE